MKFVAGNIEFTDNIKQLLTDISIFDRIINEEPTILENTIWRKQIGISNLSSGSLVNNTDDILYRSCYLIYKNGDPILKSNVSMVVRNIFSNEIITDFSNWGLVQIDNGMYLLFIWIDIEQKYTFSLSGINTFSTEDWFIQVVI